MATRKPRKSFEEKYREESAKPLLVPDKVVRGKKGVSARSIKTGAYQRSLLAFFAPHIIPQFFNALRRSVSDGDSQAMKLTAEMYSFTQKKGGIAINVEQNNDNRSAHVNTPPGAASLGSFEEIARAIHEGRMTRQLPAAAAIPVIATPED